MNKGFLSMNGRRTDRGFTLIELLMTIAVIAILVSVGVPMYQQFSRGSAVSGATSELIAAINEARSRAVSERRSVRLEQMDTSLPDGDWSNGWRLVRVIDASVLVAVDRRGRSLSIRVREDADAPAIVFDKEGRATSGAASFLVCNPGNTDVVGRAVTVTAFGRVTVVQQPTTMATCPP